MFQLPRGRTEHLIRVRRATGLTSSPKSQRSCLVDMHMQYDVSHIAVYDVHDILSLSYFFMAAIMDPENRTLKPLGDSKVEISCERARLHID